MAAWAHAQLFATLASQGADGVVVLRELTQRIKKKAGPAADVVLRMIAGLLSIRDPRTGHPAVAQFLIGNPDLAGELAPLWAKALVMRPWRAGAVAAILGALGAIAHGRGDPEGLARAFGAAVGRELPEAERRPLCDDVLALEQTERRHKVRKRKPAEDADEQPVPTLASESLLETFLSACTHPNDVRFPHSRWAHPMTRYPIISQRVLAAADRGGLLGLGARRRPTSELPLPNPHEAVVYKSGGNYIVDNGRTRPHDDHVVNATSISVIDMRKNKPVMVQTSFP